MEQEPWENLKNWKMWGNYAQMLHVWYIYLHDWVILGKGKCWCAYSSTMVLIWASMTTWDLKQD